ncbi:NAD(P)/FAD-dependent oxidoreductase, partial [Pseudomonas aeruginosa]|nr:FAD-binding oxidoreductase [Pseudomonas aeruginosa]
ALNYREEGDGYRVRTEHGEIRCAALVLACNAYIDGLDSELSQRMLPVGTYQVATEPLGEERAKSLLPRNCCVTDNQFVLDYFRLTPDHRLLFGGGCTYLGGMPSDIRAATRPYLERVFPQLRGVALEYAWGGHIDCSMRRTPDIGRQGNRYWLQGYSGHGVLPSLAAARAVSDALLGDDETLALYQRLRNPKFPGGQRFAAPLEALGKAYYRLRDLF